MDTKKLFGDFTFRKTYDGKKVAYSNTVQGFDDENDTVELCKDLSDYIYGQSIVEINRHDCGDILDLVLGNGLVLRVASNEGCGGCANGWYCCDEVIDTGTQGNIITKVEVKQPEDCENGTYTLFIYSQDKRILEAGFSGCDNGYYGVGIYVSVTIPKEVATKFCDDNGITEV